MSITTLLCAIKYSNYCRQKDIPENTKTFLNVTIGIQKQNKFLIILKDFKSNPKRLLKFAYSLEYHDGYYRFLKHKKIFYLIFLGALQYLP